jgi:FlaA1/EpsC-like NDP-sugar epimerase
MNVSKKIFYISHWWHRFIWSQLCCELTLKKYNPKRLIIFSRDEMKQWEMAKLYKDNQE